MKSIKCIQNEKGQGLIEYLIIVALVAVGTIGVIRVVGQSLSVKFAVIARSLGADVDGTISTPKLSESTYRKKDLRDFASGNILSKDNNKDE